MHKFGSRLCRIQDLFRLNPNGRIRWLGNSTYKLPMELIIRDWFWLNETWVNG